MAKSPELCTFVDLQRDRELPAFFSFSHVSEATLARGEGALVLGYCDSAVQELVAFVASPPRSTIGASAPKMTMLQLGLENKDFKVFVRVRPHLSREAGMPCCCEVNDVTDPRGRQVQQVFVGREGGRGPDASKREFVFERIFRAEATQDEVWTALSGTLDVAGALLQGVGATVFAYGQTGSGKTHTIDGDGSGIVWRIVRDLYGRLASDQVVCAEYVQLYNEEFLDLFAPMNKLGQDGSGVVTGARQLQLATADELLTSIRLGSAIRASGATNMNDASSRSHSVLILSLGGGASEFVSQGTNSVARLFVVDLAGSERIKRSGVTGARLSEAVAINQSLLALSNVTQALVENDGKPRAHIPYRDSALTQLLRRSLGGSSRSALIACVSPAADSLEETLGTLRFAACATHVRNRTSEAKQEVEHQVEDDRLNGALLGQSVDFRCGEAMISTSGGNIHCYGDLSAPADSPVVVMIHYYSRESDGRMWQCMFDSEGGRLPIPGSEHAWARTKHRRE
ncbi:unnamed protein product [Polarella glacialis]|uniref:Kinesin-like protein n=1 Tax=Polarella glacialis TaxID=89957 RepID=A0A813G290_POLGL|nr:unnamed protein product [Polarella glacialis]